MAGSRARTGEILFTTGEVAAHCGVSYEAVKEWIRTGQLIAYVTPGKHRRIPAAAFNRFLRNHHWPPLTAAEPPPAKRRILVVDDDPDVVCILVKFLAKAGEYDLVTAADGFEAGLQVARFAPDLIILDLMMPQPDGFQVCHQIKSRPETKGTLILVLTGYATPENIQKAREAGADYCLAKPFKTAALRQILREMFAGTYKMSQTA